MFYLRAWRFGPNGEVDTQPSFTEAAKWLALAAEQGDTTAQWNLGGLYLQGLGVEKNGSLAYKWAYLASQNAGRPHEMLARVAEQITTADLIEGERLALAWMKRREATSAGQ